MRNTGIEMVIRSAFAKTKTFKRPARSVKRNGRAQIVSGMNGNDRWIARHFQELVEKYAGKYVAVSHRDIAASGDDLSVVRKNALVRYPDENPSMLHVPQPEALECLLFNLNSRCG